MQQIDNFYVPPQAPASEQESFAFNFAKLLAGYYFIELAQVTAVNEDETIDVLPLVMQLDSANNPIQNSNIYNIPIARLQFGESAIVMDPAVGDIGIIGVCDKDITTVKTSKSESSPPTSRRHSRSDAVYLFGVAMLNKAPTEYIKFTGSGINIKSPGPVNINGLQISSSGQLTLVDGSVVDKHTHGGVESGGSSTSPLGG